MTRYQYNGDVDVENGGYWASTGPEERRYGYSSVVRVTPCADAGGPDNMFWVETLTVNIPDDKRLAMAFDFCGYKEDWLKGLTPFQRFCRAVDACLSVGHYEPDDTGRPWSQLVQIGADDSFYRPSHDTWTADRKLRANWKLRNWIKAIYLKA